MQKKAPTKDFLSILAKIVGTKVFQELKDTHFFSSENKIARLLEVCSDLEKSQLLNEDSLVKARERITIRLPKADNGSLIKIHHKDAEPPYLELHLDEKPPIFLPYTLKKEEQVKTGYDSLAFDKPTFSIKKNLLTTREAKYQRLLGRNAFYFSKDKHTFHPTKGNIKVIADWIAGKALSLFDKEELQKLPVALRIRCLSTAMAELNILHRHYRMHGDLKPSNVILDLESCSLRLIDFNFSHKMGPKKEQGHTPFFTESNVPLAHLAQDLYAMGMVVITLFPDLYRSRIDFDSEKMIAFLYKDDLTITEQAVVNLVNALRHPELQMRCTSEDASKYCLELLTKIERLDALSLAEMTKSTIARSNTTVEDVLRHRMPG